MAKTVADLLIERLIDWGVDTIFGFPGDGINGIFEALRTRRKDPLHPGPPRGSRRVRRLRLRQVHRPAGRVHGDLRAGRHPSAQRPVRRQVRRPAGAGHHRPHLPRPDRHALPAGRRSHQAVHGRGRLQQAHHRGRPRSQRLDDAIRTAMARQGVAHQPSPRTFRMGRLRPPRAPGRTSRATAATESPSHAARPSSKMISRPSADVINRGGKR